MYLLHALTIGHISYPDELKCYFNTHVCTGPMYPPPFQTHDPDVQQFFVLRLCMYFCMDLSTNVNMILFGNKLPSISFM